MYRLDRTGLTYGWLTAVRWVSQDKKGNARWECSCSCGTVTTVLGFNLQNGNTQSCGCKKRALAAAGSANKRHGMEGTPEYSAWSHAVQRTTNPNDKRWPDYGGRGITMCPQWLGPGGFDRFFAHIGFRLDPSFSLDRINNEQGYWPGNVRWTDRKTQRSNQRRRAS